jgi:hypothetical protein
MYNSSTSGTIQLQYLKIETAETINPNVLIVGNSKTKVGYSGAWIHRFPIQLNATYPTVAYSAGSAEYASDALLKIDEMTQYNPEYVIIADHPSNDLREGASLQTSLDRAKALYDAFANGGSKVYFMPLPEDSVGANQGLDGLSALKGALFSIYPNNVINAWDSLSTNNVLKSIYNSGDNVHLNKAAMDKIVEAIIASGKILTLGTQRRTPYRATDGVVKAVGDSLFFRYKIAPIKNVLPKFNSDYDLVGSIVHDDATNVIVSTTRNPTAPSGSVLFNVNGASATYGSLSTMRMYDRTSASEFMEFYKNGDFRFSNHSGQVAAIDNNGKWTIGFDVNRQVAVGSLMILKGYSVSSTLGLKGFALNVDSANFTVTTATNYGDGAVASIGRSSFTGPGGGATYNNLSSLLIEGAPIAGSNMTITNPWALYINSGKTKLGTVDSTSAPVNMLYEDVNGEVKKAAVPVSGQITLKGSTTWDPGSIGANSSTSTTLTVTGAALGDGVTISKTSGSYSNGELYFAYVSATNTVTIQLQNVSGGSFDIASATFNVIVLKH